MKSDISRPHNHIPNYFLKKEGFFKTFVVLVLGCGKIEKD